MQETYYYHLERRLRISRYVPNVSSSSRCVVSSHTVEAKTHDPFGDTFEAILALMPGWYCYHVESQVDREFKQLFEDDCEGRR